MKFITYIKLLTSFTTLSLVLNCKETSTEQTTKASTDKTIDQLFKEIDNKKVAPKLRIDKSEQAIALAKTQMNDSVEFAARFKKMELLRSLELEDKAHLYNHQIIDWTKKINNKKLEAEAYFNFGNYFYDENNMDSAFYYYNYSKNYYSQINDSIGLAKSSLNMAIILNDNGDHSGSENLAMEALNALKNYPKHPYLTPIFNSLAISSGSMLNFNEELYWYDRALELNTDHYFKVSIENNKAVAYTLLKRYDDAIKTLEAVKNDTILDNELHLKSKVIDNLAYAKWLKNPSLNIESELLKALDIRKEIDYAHGQSVNLQHLSEYYEAKDPQRAADYAKQMYDLSFVTGNIEARLSALKKLIEINSGSNPSVIKEFIELNDSLQLSRSKTKYQFAKLKYDADKNRNEIQALSLERAEHLLELERAKISTIIAIAILIIAIIIFYVRIYQQKQKRKNDRLKTIYDTEVSLSQKLHDELANDLFNTITLLESIQFENQFLKKKLSDNLDHIYAQTRSISRQTNTVDTANFKKELDSMLASYKSEDVNILTKGIDLVNWDTMENHTKIVIYRVLMELMTNMKKHSDCTLVVISFLQEGKNLEIKYVDNGSISIDQDILSKNGIRNMENRIRGIDGTINFEISKGFRAFINIPN